MRRPMPDTTSIGTRLCWSCLANLRPRAARRGPLWSLLGSHDGIRNFQTGATVAAAAAGPAPHPKHAKRRRQLHGREVHEHLARLDTPSLGNPVDVVVLRDAVAENAEAERRRVAGLVKKRHGKGLSAEELVQSMDGEKSPIDLDTALQNLDRLRPPVGRALSEADHDRLAQQLHSGFTSAQLKAYVARRRAELPEAGATRPIEGLLAVRRWRRRRGVPADDQRSPETSATSRGAASKAGLVTRLLKECWQMTSTSEVQPDGELIMRVRSHELALFFDDARSFAKQVARRHRVNIEASRRDGVITIQGNEGGANAAAIEIECALEQVQRMTIDLEPLLAAQVSSEGRSRLTDGTHLQSIQSMTGAAIRLDENHKALRLCSLGPSRTSLDDARRLLLVDIGSLGETRTYLKYEEASPHGPTALYAIGAVDHLPWKDRTIPSNSTWARCRYQARRHTEESRREPSSTAAGTDPEQDDHALALATATHTALRLAGPSVALISPLSGQVTHATWADHEQATTTACIGNVLHRIGSSQPVWPTSMRESAERAVGSRTFTYDVPGLVQAMASLGALEPRSTPPGTLVLHLKPSPWSAPGGKPALRLPAMEILLEVDPDRRQNRLLKVEAVVEQRVLDVMLPARATDMRFVARSTLELLNPARSQSIQDFLSRSRLEIWGRDRLKAAPGLSIQIPRSILPNEPFAAGPATEEATAEPVLSPDGIPTEYLFTGLEYRQTIDMVVEGWRAQYTTVEAGKAGGRWGELTLRMERAPSVPGHVDAVEQAERAEDDASKVSSDALHGPEPLRHAEDDETGSHRAGHTFLDFFGSVRRFVDHVHLHATSDQTLSADQASQTQGAGPPMIQSPLNRG